MTRMRHLNNAEPGVGRLVVFLRNARYPSSPNSDSVSFFTVEAGTVGLVYKVRYQDCRVCSTVGPVYKVRYQDYCVFDVIVNGNLVRNLYPPERNSASILAWFDEQISECKS